MEWTIKSVMVILVGNILEKTFALNLRVEVLAIRVADESFLMATVAMYYKFTV